MTMSPGSIAQKESRSRPNIHARTRGRRMDPRNATMDPTDSGRKQHQVRLARLPVTLLSPLHQYPGGFHGQEKPHSAKNEVPRYRLLYSRLRTNRPKSPVPLGITRNEPAILGWIATRHS